MPFTPLKLYGNYGMILPIATSPSRQGKHTVFRRNNDGAGGQCTSAATATHTIGDDPYSYMSTITAGRTGILIKSTDGNAIYETNRESFARRGLGNLTDDWPQGYVNRMRVMHKAWGCTQIQRGANVTNSKETHHYSAQFFPPDKPRTTSSQEQNPDYAPSDGSHGKTYVYFLLPDEFQSEDCGWVQIVIDPKHQALRDWKFNNPPYSHRPYAENIYATWGPPEYPEPQPWPDYGYFDCVVDWYFRPKYSTDVDRENGHERGYQVFSTPLMYEEETSANGIVNEINLVTHISNLCATYIASTNKVWWQCESSGTQSMLGASYVIECRYSFSTTYVEGGFDAAEPMPTPTNAERAVTNDIYTCCSFEEVDIVWPEGEAVMYIALRVQGAEGESWGHREIAVCYDNNQMPPLPGETL